MFACNGHTTSEKMKSHSFCVPHNGADILSKTLVLNKKCLENFTMIFIGDNNMLKVVRSANKITAHTVSTELSFHVLMYLKNAGHPLYTAIILPEFEQFSKDITALSNKAFDSIFMHVI